MSGRITALRVDRRDPGYLRVFLDERFAFRVPLLEGARLAEGQELAPEDCRRWRLEDQRRQALGTALGMLARRPHSRREIEQGLRRRRISRDIVEATLGRLDELRYLDDGAYARQWVAQRMRQSPRSMRALAHELQERGVAPEEIRAALAQADDLVMARACLARRRRSWEGLEPEARRRKMLSILQNKGFPYDIAREAAEAPEEGEERP